MDTSSKWLSVLFHFIAGIVIVALPVLMTGVPLDWQTMTLGGILAALLKWAHLYLTV